MMPPPAMAMWGFGLSDSVDIVVGGIGIVIVRVYVLQGKAQGRGNIIYPQTLIQGSTISEFLMVDFSFSKTRFVSYRFFGWRGEKKVRRKGGQ